MESNIANVNLNLSDVVTRVNKGAASFETSQNKALEQPKEEGNIQYTDKISSGAKNVSTDEKDLSAAIDIVASFIKPQIRNVNFTQDESSGKTVVKVFDTQSKELIKQFPSEEILELSEKIKGLQSEIANRTGILIDDKV